MATPKVGVDGRRRLTVTVTVFDDNADVLWAAGYLNGRGASSGVSKWARSVLEEALRVVGEDPEVRRAVELVAEARADRETALDAAVVSPARLRLVR